MKPIMLKWNDKFRLLREKQSFRPRIRSLLRDFKLMRGSTLSRYVSYRYCSVLKLFEISPIHCWKGMWGNLDTNEGFLFEESVPRKTYLIAGLSAEHTRATKLGAPLSNQGCCRHISLASHPTEKLQLKNCFIYRS